MQNVGFLMMWLIFCVHKLLTSGIFLAILGRGPRAFLIGKISDKPRIWEILRIFKVDNIFQVDIVNQAYAFRIINNSITSNLNSISNS